MLTVKDIADIYKEMDGLAVRYKGEYEKLLSELYKNTADLKYSAGGRRYPAGKYFWGKSKLYRKVVRQSSGHFCKSIEAANYIYSFSEDGRLLAFNKIDDPDLPDDTGFFVYEGEKIYFLNFHEGSVPQLGSVGMIINKDGCEIMAEGDVPLSPRELCTFLDITVIDREKDNEYVYGTLSRSDLEREYDITSEEEFPEYWALNKQA